MRVLVTGAHGMLGHDLVPQLERAGHDVTALSRADLDITDLKACMAAVEGHDAVVNAAAWTAVDDAEAQEEQAYAVNATGAANIATAAQAHGARVVHISTDYVFAGDADSPYPEDAPTEPQSAYGRTKLAGERAVRELCPDSCVVRTAWLYGAGGPNFLATMARLAGSHDQLSVVDDQRGQPTWTADLAERIVDLLSPDAPAGIYHGTASGETTWFGLTRALFTELGLDPERVLPTTTDAFPRPAPRPAYSVLGHQGWERIGKGPMRDWRTALSEAVPTLGLARAERDG